MRSSLVERFPDKKEAHGPIPCAPTDMTERKSKGYAEVVSRILVPKSIVTPQAIWDSGLANYF